MAIVYCCNAMSTSDELKHFVKRFQAECLKHGIKNPTELSVLLTQKGFPVQYNTVYKNWIGQNYPSLESLIAYGKTLDINLHYLITGEQPPPSGDPKKLFKEFIEEHFQPTPNDAKLRRLTSAWGKMTPQQRDALIMIADGFMKLAD